MTPDSVKTRIGTLEFVDGVPTEATTKALYDNLDFNKRDQQSSLIDKRTILVVTQFCLYWRNSADARRLLTSRDYFEARTHQDRDVELAQQKPVNQNERIEHYER